MSIGLKRDTIDKFYTKSSIVDLCLKYFREHIKIKSGDLIIEPSAGNGSFIQGIKEMTSNFLFYDIEPANEEIVKQDYLLAQFNGERAHILGNPPFGRQSSLAIKFIKKSCEFCETLSFILPKSFKKDSLKKSFPQNFHLIFEVDLPDKSFLVGNLEHDVPCIFQIWEKRNTDRKMVKKLEPTQYTFVKKTENPDISFRRVGVNAGKIDTNIEKSVQSHYFIKFTKGLVDENIKKLSKITFDSNNTVGPKSISKQELIKEFNKIL